MATIRKDKLENGQYYHIYSRSIAKYVIFNNTSEFNRMVDLLFLSNFVDFDYEYSKFSRLMEKEKKIIIDKLLNNDNKLVEIVAYCLMPTHLHALLKQICDSGVTKYLNRSLSSYSKFFNTKHQRTGPLWESRFKNVLINDDQQLLHLTRYIHLNPTSAGLVIRPEDWPYSSYSEYIDGQNDKYRICNKEIIDMDTRAYKNFVNDNKKYQRELSIIKNLIIDDHTG